MRYSGVMEPSHKVIGDATGASSPAKASFLFIKRDSWPKLEKPYLLYYEPINDLPHSNYAGETVDNIPIHDIREQRTPPSLEREGFAITRIVTAMTYSDFWDETKLTTVFAEELRQHLCSLLAARAAYIHECVIRKRSDQSPSDNGGYGHPVRIVHTDYTAKYLEKLVRQLAGDQADDILSSKYEMINAWKTLRGPLRDWPLALCAKQSIGDEDIIAIDEVHARDTLESQLLAYSSSHKWFYLDDQEPDELIVWKSTDVPHASFDLGKADENPEPRESIEFRVLVVY